MTNIKSFLKFLSRNKLYTFVSIAGFSIALMFVIILGLYVKQELSVDDFQKNRDRIFLIAENGESYLGNPVGAFVQENFPEVESYVRVLSRDVALGKKGTDKVKVKALFADSTFFNIFSFKLVEGDAQRVLEARKSVVVTRNFASRFFGNEDPMGKSLIIDDTEHTITGIMEDLPRQTMIPEADILVNYHSITQYWGDQILEQNNNFGFTIFFLEKKGADFASKAPDLLRSFKENFWPYESGFRKTLQVVPMKDAYFTLTYSGYGNLRNNSRTAISVYLAIAILILIVALLNYVNLTLAQAGFRGKAAAIMKLLGSSKTALIGKLLMESLLMTLSTFLIGLLLAFLAEPYFNNALGTELNLKAQFTPTMIVFCILFVLLISFLAGIIPALVISRFNPLEVVKGTLTRKIKSSYSNVLIVFQYAVAIALLICSLFIQQQSDYLVKYDLGYNHEGILQVVNTGLEVNQIEGFKAKLLSIPGVEEVSFSCGTPFDGGNNNSYEQDGEQFSFQEFYVDSAFFHIYGITIEPTGIPPTDDTWWLNEKAYKAVHPDTANQTFRVWGGEEKAQIAGIINDFKIRSLHENYDLLRVRWRTTNEMPWVIIVKMAHGTDYNATAKKVEKAYDSYTGGQLYLAYFVDDGIQKSYENERKISAVINAFTLLTIVIMIMGVFAMSLYMIRQKEKEIALRKVNGSTETEILFLLNRDSLNRVFIAFLIAAPVAYYAMSKWLDNYPYRISLTGWVFLLAGAAVLFLTILSVSYVTWKAARANPVVALKGE